MSDPNSAFDDLLLYALGIPMAIVVISCGFCIVYRHVFNIPVFGNDFTVTSRGKENDPGRADWEYQSTGSSTKSPSIYSNPQQPPRMNSWDV